jgi:XRE family transcriptional regulator, regulator of sulfur utilization
MIGQADREHIAARWLIEQDDPSFSDEQREELARWLVESVDNCSAYLRLVHAWRKTALLRRSDQPVTYGRRKSSSAVKRVPKSAGKRGASTTVDPAILNQRFGTLIRDNRKAHGWTQDTLAAKAKVDRSYLSQLEMGHVSPTLMMMFRISRALKITTSELLSQLERLPRT